MEGAGDADDAEILDNGVAEAFVEGEGRGVETAGGIGDAEHVEIALEDAVLAGVAVDDDEGEVEVFDALDGEVASIDREVGAIVCEPVPVGTIDDDFIDIVFFVVEVVVNLAAAIDGDLVFARVAAHDEGNVQFGVHYFNVKCCMLIVELVWDHCLVGDGWR